MSSPILAEEDRNDLQLIDMTFLRNERVALFLVLVDTKARLLFKSEPWRNFPEEYKSDL